MSEFIAEARVLVTPDTTKFRAELQTLLATATKGVTVPVTIAPVGGSTAAFAAAQKEATAATLGLASATVVENEALKNNAVLLDAGAVAASTEAAALERAGAAKTAAAVSTKALTTQQTLAAAAAQKLAFSQEAVIGASSEAAAASIAHTRATAAVAAAERALGAALNAKNIALIDAAALELRLAEAQSAEALAALEAARAQQLHAASLGQVQKAGLASFASMLGLRGAVLTAGTAFLGATVGITAFAKAVQSAADLERELNTFQVTAGATADEMERVGAAATALGRDVTLPATTANDAAQAMTNLAKAGLDVEESIAGSKGVLQLAAAAQIDVADATEISANALNTFSLNGTEATRVADLLTGASIAAQGDIQTMGIALGQAGAAAKLAGVSLEDTIALISLLAKNGLQGSDAGTSLRTAFLALASPTDKAKKIIKELNLELTDLQGNLRPEVFAEFFQATETLSRIDRLNLAVQVFGRDAVRALGLIGEEGVGALEDMRSRTGEAGLAAKVAGARMRGLSGDVEALSSNLSTLGTTLGQGVTPILSSFTRGLNLAVKGVNELFGALGSAPISPVFEQTGTAAEQLSAKIAETQRQIDSFGDSSVPPTLVERLAELNFQWAEMSGATHDANLGIAEFIDRAQEAAAAAQKLANPLASVASILARDIAIAAASGDTGRELEKLRQREANQQAFLDRILKRPSTEKNVALAEQAANNLDATRNRIQSILDEEVADEKRATTAAEKAAKDAQEARDKQFEAIAETFGGRQGAIENKIARAGIADNVQKQINLTKALIASLKKERDALLVRLKTLKVSNEVRKRILRAITAAIEEAQQDILRLQKEQADAVQSFATPAIDLRIRIAQARDNTQQEIKLRRQRLELIRKELERLAHQGKKNTLAWLELKAQQAEEAAAIKDLEEETKKKNQAQSSAFFTFLQTQEGFAANLLGNLIPGFATRGLVGGGGDGSAPAAGQGFEQLGVSPGQGVNQAAAVGAGVQRGVKPVQVDTTNHLLRQILSVLQGRQSKGNPPEIIHNRGTANAQFDTLGH